MCSCFTVPHRLIPVCCGHHRRASRNLHKWDSVLVHGMCLHSGPPHSSLYFHSVVVPTATLKCLSGMYSILFESRNHWVQKSLLLNLLVFVIFDQHLLLYSAVSRATLQQSSSHLWNFDFHFPDGG